MNDNTNWELLAKYISGDATSAEREEMELWINGDKSNRELYLSMKKMWDMPEERFEASDTKDIWRKIKLETGIESFSSGENNSLKNKPSIFQIIYGSHILKYAAAIVIVLSIFFIYYFSNVSTSREFITLKVEFGEQQKIVFSDGSKITVDAGSILKYPETFPKDYREIELQGEAFFEVENIEDLPFKVNANQAIVQVIGTKFNISTFNENKDVNVFVAEGKVSLSSKNKLSQKQTLSKGQYSSVDKGGNLAIITTESPESKLSWISGKKYFENVKLKDVLNQIERWYDVHFQYDEKKLKNDELTLNLHKKSLTDMLEILSRLTTMDYDIDGKLITLKFKELVHSSKLFTFAPIQIIFINFQFLL